PDLRKLLDDSDMNTRYYAAGALAMIGESDKALVRMLGDALTGGQGDVQVFAAEALGKVGGPAVPVLMPALDDTNPAVRQPAAAAHALGQIGPDAKGALRPLGKALADPSQHVRKMAAEALGKVGDDAVPLLTDALKEKDAGVRAAAARGLGQVGGGARPAV